MGADEQVNHPSHYTYGSVEVVDIIEGAIAAAPGNREAYHQASALKYLLRAGRKGAYEQDIAKARWHLERLLDPAR